LEGTLKILWVSEKIFSFLLCVTLANDCYTLNAPKDSEEERIAVVFWLVGWF